MANIKSASLDELRALKAAGKISAPTSRNTVEDLPDEFWDNAKLVMPQTKKAVSLRVDPDVLAFFKAQGNGHLTRMHAVLKAYVDAQKKRAS